MSEQPRNARREFLKKAGVVGWAVPTITVLNLPAAVAGGDVQTSVTTTTVPATRPPTTTTTMPQGCQCSATLVSAQVVGGSFRFVIDIDVSGCDDITLASLVFPGVGGTTPIGFESRMEFFTNSMAPVPGPAFVQLFGPAGEVARCHLDLPAPACAGEADALFIDLVDDGALALFEVEASSAGDCPGDLKLQIRLPGGSIRGPFPGGDYDDELTLDVSDLPGTLVFEWLTGPMDGPMTLVDSVSVPVSIPMP